MELKSFDSSRLVFLTTIRRSAGALFAPFAGAALVDRYKFVKAPTHSELLADSFTFQHGVFNNTAIGEFSLYQDGIVMAARASTNFLDDLLSDILTWAEAEWGIKETGVPPREKHYESNIIVGMAGDLNKTLSFLEACRKQLGKYQSEYGLPHFNFDASGFGVSVDQSAYPGRKPVSFSLGRRINVPHDAGIYYSTAPLKTDDHLALLENLERSLR